MDMDAVAALLKETADEVINPRFRELAAGEIDEKRPGDYVTIADRESEEYLSRRLAEAHPEALIVGEEGSFLGTSSIDELATVPHAFVIDPIDGTRNFVHGKPEHGVMLAEVRDGVTTRGWIWHPQLGTMVTVERGAGEVLLNGEPIVAKPGSGRPLGATGRKHLIGFDGHGALAPTVRSSGAACVDYLHIVQGAIDFMAFATAHPWDHLAGCLMLEESGGVGRLLGGERYGPATRGKGLLVARTPEIWQTVADVWPR